MGRIVSCKQCGTWGELPPTADAAEWLCESCAGGANPLPDAPAQGDVAAPTVQTPSGSGISIGRSSGTIGAGALDLSTSSLDEQLREMHEAVDRIRVGSVDLQAIQDRLAAGSKHVSMPDVASALPERTPATTWRDRAGEVTDDLAATAQGFARDQAGKVIDRAEKLFEEKGLGAVDEAKDFARREAVRVAKEARELAARKARAAASKAAETARRAVGPVKATRVATPAAPASPTVKRAIPKQASSVCVLCGDRIVLGDRVVSCPDCGQHYHADCYQMMGACVSDSCRGKPQGGGYKVPEPPATAQRAVTRQPATRRCSGCGSAVSARALVCPQCGAWLSRRKRQSTLGRRYNNASPFPEGCAGVILVIVAIAVGLMALL